MPHLSHAYKLIHNTDPSLDQDIRRQHLNLARLVCAIHQPCQIKATFLYTVTTHLGDLADNVRSHAPLFLLLGMRRCFSNQARDDELH